MMYRLQRQKSGALAVHNAAFAETMHPGAGPWAEATQLYVQGSGLPALLRHAAAAPGARGGAAPLVLFDVGLGAAANALAALTCHDDLARRGQRPRPLRIVSFEADPAALRFAIAEADGLGYPRGHEATLEALLREGRAEPAAHQRWELRVGDFPRLIQEEPARADVVFFDPFSPRANPDMWSLATLEALYRCRRRDGPARLVTYSTAFGARAALLLAGFFVGEGPRGEAGQGGREGRGTTLAAGRLADLERPLTPAWLARWRHDREPWPPLTASGAQRALRQRLLAHPQWEHFAQAAAQAARARPARVPAPSASHAPQRAKPPVPQRAKPRPAPSKRGPAARQQRQQPRRPAAGRRSRGSR